MARPLFQLGDFQFDLPNGVPQTLDRTAEFRWEQQDRLLRDPALQFLGPGAQEITLDGVLLPGLSGTQGTMETLRTLAARGEPLMLTAGNGRVFGRWAIRQIREGQGTFAPGGAARQITFSLSLARYVEDNPGQASSPLALVNSSAPSTTLAQLSGGTGQFTAPGGAFEAVSLNGLPSIAALPVSPQAAGIGVGQVAAIARAVTNRNYVGAALGAFGLAGLNPQQVTGWLGQGINAAQLVQQVAQGRGAPAMAVALDALRPAATSALQAIGGSGPAGDALGDLVRNAATITTILDVDPFTTAAVREALQP
jgi:phage protein U